MMEQHEAPVLAVEPLRLPSRDLNAYGVECGPAGWYPSPPGLLDVPVRTPAPFDHSAYLRVAVKSADHIPHPAPEVTSTWTHENWEEEWYPSGPRAFAKRARAAGWDVRVGFSRGSIPGAKKDTYATRDMIGVWLDGFGKRAGVFWERNPDAEFSAKKLEAGPKPGEIPSGMNWTTKGGSIRFGPGMSFPYPNLTQMDEWVALQGAVLPGWYEGIKTKVLEAEAAAKARADAKAKHDREWAEQRAHESATQ